MSTPRVAALIPCYNTSEACRAVVAGAADTCAVVLAIDDGSTDDTAVHLAASRCEVLTLRPNRGKGAALEAGLRRLLARRGDEAIDYVLVVDGDGQHLPADIPRFLTVAGQLQPDLIIGVRDPRAMPRRNRIGAHFSRLLFLIGTSRFVADTQCGFRLLSAPLLHSLLGRVSWRGYETESQVLWRALEERWTIVPVPVSTIYLDGNRRSQFRAWRDSTRIAAVFAPQIAWTVAMAGLDLALFSALVRCRNWTPVAANLAARPAAVALHLAIRPDGLTRLGVLTRQQGGGATAAAFAAHLALTTALVGGLHALGVRPIVAKALGQLAGYLAGFAVADRVMLRRTVASPARDQGGHPAASG